MANLFAPKPPTPPDPRQTAGAQTATNIGTGIVNNKMQQVNQKTPWGNQTYEQTGTYQYTDPNTGAVHDIPTTTATTTLPKEQQDALNAQNKAGRAMSRTARDQAQFLRGYMGQGVNTSGLPDIQTGGPASQFRETQAGGRIATGGVKTPEVISREARGGNIQTDLQNGGNLQRYIANSGDVQKSVQNGGNIQRQFGDGGDVTRGIEGAGDITKSYGTDYSADRQNVEDALMQRMDPYISRDREALQARLANQGITPGSEAYEREMFDMERQIGDQRMGAVLSAGQEQSRLAGLTRDAAQFENQAQQQQFGQNLTDTQIANQAQQQKFGQNQALAQFGNQAAEQAVNRNLAVGQFANQAQQQRFGQNLAAGQFGNDAAGQAFARNLAAGQFGNQAQQQAYSQDAGNIERQNAAKAQRFGQNVTNRALTNQAQQQGFDQGRAMTGDYNANQGANFNQIMAMAQQNNAARSQGMQEQFALRNQPLNEIASLMSGSQVSNPSFGVSTPGAIPTVDYAGLQNQNYANQMAGYGTQMQNRNQLLGGVAGAVSPFLMSDRRLKRDVVRVGEVGPLGVYEYQYVWGGPRQLGYMADEVAQVRPDAVAWVGEYMAVDYSKLPEVA